jgi:hypothetical protein
MGEGNEVCGFCLSSHTFAEINSQTKEYGKEQKLRFGQGEVLDR